MKSLHAFFWLWIPLLFLVVQLALEFSFSRDVMADIMNEKGPHELVQALVMLAAFIVALMTLARMKLRQNIWLTLWVAIAALCSFYVAGEEVSWGQQLLHWQTPESWAVINDQNETNLHNTSSWFDQKPKLLLMIGIFIGGVVIPFLRKYKPGFVPEKYAVIYPSGTFLAVIASLAVGVHLFDKFSELFARASEVVELYMFYFVLLYLVDLRSRILQDQR